MLDTNPPPSRDDERMNVLEVSSGNDATLLQNAAILF
jgi:hypothetical protein